MKNLTLRKIAEVTGGRLINPNEFIDREISSVITDSRKVVEDCLFICIKGEKSDGHDYADIVMVSGALGLISEKNLGNVTYPYILVDSSLKATQQIAELYRRSLDIVVVGVTGSVGKTSTKEYISKVLEKKYRVHKTQGNLNNDWGVPFTIFGIKETDQIAVIEMGISHFGDMDRLAKMARPNIVVITNIGQSHIEYFGDRDGILKAKCEIFNYMSPDGVIILNGDDDKLSTIKSVNGIKPEFFGMKSDTPLRAERIVNHGLDGTEFDLIMKERGGSMRYHLSLPVPGEQMIYNAMAATLVGNALNVPQVLVKEALSKIDSMSGRNNIIQTGRYTIIDDAYNASPSSMESSIDILKNASGRKVAILGDMFELGEKSDKFHFQVGRYAGNAEIDLIICVGTISDKTFMGAKMASSGQVEYYQTVEDCIRKLPFLLKDGDTVLVKASNAMNFAQIVDFIKG